MEEKQQEKLIDTTSTEFLRSEIKRVDEILKKEEMEESSVETETRKR